MTNKTGAPPLKNPSSEDNPSISSSHQVASRKRRLLLSTLASGSAAGPILSSWNKPIVQSFLLPLHAQSSPGSTPPTSSSSSTPAPTPASPRATPGAIIITKHIITIPAFSGGVDAVGQTVAFVAIAIKAPEELQDGTFAIDIRGINITPQVSVTADDTADTIVRKFIGVASGAAPADATVIITPPASNEDPTLPKFNGIGFTGRVSTATDFGGNTTTYLVIESVEIDAEDNASGNYARYIDAEGIPYGMRGVGTQHAELNTDNVRVTHSTTQGNISNILADTTNTAGTFAFSGGVSGVEEENAAAEFTLVAYDSGGGDNDDYLQIDGVPIELGSEDLTAAQVAAVIRDELKTSRAIKTSRQQGQLPYDVLDAEDTDDATVVLQIRNGGIIGNTVPALTVQNANYNTG